MLRRGAVVALVLSLVACGSNSSSSGTAAQITSTAEPAGSHCAHGGQRFDITQNGQTTSAYVCNGTDGAAPANVSVVDASSSQCPSGGLQVQVGSSAPVAVCNGTNGAAVSVASEPAGTHCAAGGVAVQVGSNAATYVCNGAPGESATVTAEPPGTNCPSGGIAVQVGNGAPAYVCSGADGQSVSVTAELAGSHCTYGGEKLQVGSAPATYVCNGAPGADGQSVTMTSESPGSHCTYGGVALTVGSSTSYVCNGGPGATGADGQSVTVTPEAPGSNCATGGEALTVGTSTSYVCNGDVGQSVTLTAEPAGSNCPRGGVALQVGSGPVEYVCNGSSLVWSTITSDTQAAGNAGYVSSSDAPVTLTLPPSSGLNVGDVIEVLVKGEGSVSIRPNAGQIFQYQGLARSWTRHSVQNSSGFMAIGSTPDGGLLAATDLDNGIFISRDFGDTWTESEFFAGSPAPSRSVDVSADGSTVAFAAYSFGVSFSINSGSTWHLDYGYSSAYAMAMSSDGTWMFETLDPSSGGSPWLISSGGASFTPQPAAPGTGFIAASADGSHLLIAGVSPTQGVFTSPDFGNSWTTRTTGLPTGVDWLGARSSADGSRLIIYGTAGVFTSSDSGATWTDRSAGFEGQTGKTITAVDCTPDGKTLAATDSAGDVFISRDSGVTWSRDAGSPGVPAGVAITLSADGTHIAVVQGDTTGNPNLIFTSVSTGAMVAHTFSKVELTYVGSDTFFLSGFEGDVDPP